MKRFALIVGISLFLIVTNHDVYAQDVKNGKIIFEKRCVKCHGEKGEVSEYGKAIKPFPAKDLRTNLLLDKEMRNVIQHGLYGTSMTGKRDVLTKKDLTDVMAYIRTLSYLPDIKQGKELFLEVCGACHVSKEGMELSGAINLKKSVLSRNEMAEVIRHGRYESAMLERRDSITNVDIADIISYLLFIRE